MTTSSVTSGPLRRVPVQGEASPGSSACSTPAPNSSTRSGTRALTTTLLAERAEVAIGSVYQFFPDKRAIVQALTMRNMDAYLGAWPRRFAEGSSPTGGTAWTRRSTSTSPCTARVPGFRTLHFGDVVDVHLLDEERDNNAVIAERLARSAGRAVRLTGLADVCGSPLEIAVEAADALIKLAFRRDPEGDEVVLAEAKALIREYLHRHVRRRTVVAAVNQLPVLGAGAPA